MSASTIAIPRSAGTLFYGGMAAIFFAIALVGFAPTYWVPMIRGTLDVPPLIHVHAVLFYGWMALLLKQTTLAASGRLSRHRELGVAGVALATGMVFIGLALAINSMKRLDASGFGEAGRAFSIVPVTAVLLFGTLFAAAIVNVKRPEVHKRLMLVATASMLQAAVGRWFVFFLAPPNPTSGLASPPPIAVTILPGLAVDLLIVACMIHDRRTTGRVHPAYWAGGGLVLLVQLARIPISATTGWVNVAQALLKLAP
jgi:hypothetical protein